VKEQSNVYHAFVILIKFFFAIVHNSSVQFV